jgi:hypothetical protein
MCNLKSWGRHSPVPQADLRQSGNYRRCLRRCESPAVEVHHDGGPGPSGPSWSASGSQLDKVEHG